MEEKVLIRSEQYDLKKVFKIIAIAFIVLSLLFSIKVIADDIDLYDQIYGYDHEHDQYCYKYEYLDDYYTDSRYEEDKMDCPQIVYGNGFSYAIARYFGEAFWLILLFAIPIFLICGLIYLWLHSYILVVTDKRIYGKIAWGKRVDLPVDSVSAIATIRLLNGVSISTSSGRISFRMIKNADEIYTVLNNLLIKRQSGKASQTSQSNMYQSNADELKKYKELLDSGIISQEEFEAKKKQLLGL